MKGRAVTSEGAALVARTARHFSHKVPVTSSEGNASIETRFGRAALAADGGGISIALDAANPQALPALRDVLESHLTRFAREPIEIRWTG